MFIRKRKAISIWGNYDKIKKLEWDRCFAKFRRQIPFISIRICFCVKLAKKFKLVVKIRCTDQQKAAWFEMDFCVSCASATLPTMENGPFLFAKFHLNFTNVTAPYRDSSPKNENSVLIYGSTVEVSGSTVWLPTFFKISSFVFNRRKKKLLDQHEGE